MARIFTKKEAIAIVTSCATRYQQELENRAFLLVCQAQNKTIVCFELAFFARNFLHLTGLKTREGTLREEVSATRFYKKCLAHRLSPDDFEFAEDGTSFLKLEILPAIITNNLSAKMVGNYNYSKPLLITEKLAGNSNGCIGFITDETSGELIPNTVLNEDIRDNVCEHARVLAVLRSEPKSRNFVEVTYRAKKVDLSSLKLPDTYKALLPIIMD